MRKRPPKKPDPPAIYYFRYGFNEEGGPITEVWLGDDIAPSSRYAGSLTAKQVIRHIYVPGKGRAVQLRWKDHWAIPSMDEAAQIENTSWIEQKTAEKKVSDGVQVLRQRGVSARTILYLVANAMT